MTKFTSNIFCILIVSIFSLYSNKVYSHPVIPQWVDQAVFYQIYPQTFKDTNGDGIGDLNGIIQKLDYIKSLGINALWINPFFESPFADAGYDVADFYKVAHRYGTNEDAQQLFKEAHKRGIRIILDYVVGHTSIEHPWFKASANNDAKYKNWYIWTNDIWNVPDEFKGKFIQGFGARNGAYMTNFFWCQPKLNYGFAKNEIKFNWQLPTTDSSVVALKTEMKNILRYWLKMGADGFRVDMAGSTGSEFWVEVREMFDKDYPDAFLISEWGVPSEAIKSGFHSDFLHWYKGYDNLFHKKWFTKNVNTYSFFESAGKGDITEFLASFSEQYALTKSKGYITIPVDNHDMVRVKDYGRDDRDLELIFAFQMTFPNIPFIYYGDEIGMRQLPLENIAAVEGAYGSRAGNRTPMQWDNSRNYGFSTAQTQTLYLPQDAGKDAPTVENYENTKTSLIHKVRAMITMRKNEPALFPDAAYTEVYAKPYSYPFVFSRGSVDSEQILVVLNPSIKPVTINIAVPGLNKAKKLMGDGVKINCKSGYTSVSCDSRSYSVFKF